MWSHKGNNCPHASDNTWRGKTFISLTWPPWIHHLMCKESTRLELSSWYLLFWVWKLSRHNSSGVGIESGKVEGLLSSGETANSAAHLLSSWRRRPTNYSLILRVRSVLLESVQLSCQGVWTINHKPLCVNNKGTFQHQNFVQTSYTAVYQTLSFKAPHSEFGYTVSFISR
jgi:hypothetical protein